MLDSSWSVLEVYALRYAVDAQLKELEDVQVLAALAQTPMPLDILKLIGAMRSSRDKIHAVADAYADMAEEAACP